MVAVRTTFSLPAPVESVWSDAAAKALIGQEFTFRLDQVTLPGVVHDAVLHANGALVLTIEALGDDDAES